MNMLQYFLEAWFGKEEYDNARNKEAHTWSFHFKFWGRIALALVGLCFFLWQQLAELPQWWGSDAFGALILGLAVSQAAGPIIYLLSRGMMKFFLTNDYKEALGEGRWYVTLKSTVSVLLAIVLSVLAISGLLGTRWYIKPLAFLLSFPVAWFWVFIPGFNWVGVKWIGFPKSSDS